MCDESYDNDATELDEIPETVEDLENDSLTSASL